MHAPKEARLGGQELRAGAPPKPGADPEAMLSESRRQPGCLRTGTNELGPAVAQYRPGKDLECLAESSLPIPAQTSSPLGPTSRGRVREDTDHFEAFGAEVVQRALVAEPAAPRPLSTDPSRPTTVGLAGCERPRVANSPANSTRTRTSHSARPAVRFLNHRWVDGRRQHHRPWVCCNSDKLFGGV